MTLHEIAAHIFAQLICERAKAGSSRVGDAKQLARDALSYASDFIDAVNESRKFQQPKISGT